MKPKKWDEKVKVMVALPESEFRKLEMKAAGQHRKPGPMAAILLMEVLDAEADPEMVESESMPAQKSA